MNYPTEEEMTIALTARIGDERRMRFQNSAVAICGLGGLGSNIAISLVRAGIGKLILIDFDHVDISNLNRQQYKASQIGRYKTEALCENLQEISPYVDLELHSMRMDENNYMELLSKSDIICEAFDGAEEKSKLVNFVLEKMSDKTIIASSGMAGIGSPNQIVTKKITRRFYLCGDGVSDVENGDTLYSARVALCAAHQALTVLRVIADETEI